MSPSIDESSLSKKAAPGTNVLAADRLPRSDEAETDGSGREPCCRRTERSFLTILLRALSAWNV